MLICMPVNLVGKYIQLNEFTDSIIFNITSFAEGYPKLASLIPPNYLGNFYVNDGRDFDIAYANYIMSNDLPFKEFMDIIYNLYLFKNVIILMSTDNWSFNIIESLLKLIQQRYGYNGYLANSEEDLQYISNKDNARFNPYWGLQNLDQDKERYTILTEAWRIRAGGKVNEPI